MSGEMLLSCWTNPNDLTRVREVVSDGTGDDAYLMKIKMLHQAVFDNDESFGVQTLQSYYNLWAWIATGTRENLQRLHFSNWPYKTAESTAQQVAWAIVYYLEGDPDNMSHLVLQDLLDDFRLKFNKSPITMHTKILEDLVDRVKADYKRWQKHVELGLYTPDSFSWWWHNQAPTIN